MSGNKPLAGIKVIELGQLIAGRLLRVPSLIPPRDLHRR